MLTPPMKLPPPFQYAIASCHNRGKTIVISFCESSVSFQSFINVHLVAVLWFRSAFRTRIVRLGAVQYLMHDLAFLLRFRVRTATAAATAIAVAGRYWLRSRSRRLVAHFVHVIRCRLRRAWAAAPVVCIVDAHRESFGRSWISKGIISSLGIGGFL